MLPWLGLSSGTLCCVLSMLIVLLAGPSPTYGFDDTTTHRDVTRLAVDTSKLDIVLKTDLRISDGTITRLARIIREDSARILRE